MSWTASRGIVFETIAPAEFSDSTRSPLLE